MLPEVVTWSRRRTSSAADWPLDRLLRAREVDPSLSVAVVIPALDEEATVGRVVSVVRAALVDRAPLVDELVVVDSGSTDRTVEVARDAGARVLLRAEVLPDVPVRQGKGDVLWRGVAATSSSVVAFLDSDLLEPTPAFVTGVLGPLLCDPTVSFVKAAYDRAIVTEGELLPAGGGRVTELVARPLLALAWPQLAGFRQPLGGEYAARRSLLEALPFPCGYGVELGLLVDALAAVGLDGLAEVDLTSRKHRNNSDLKLGRMAAQILQVALRRTGVTVPQPLSLMQPVRDASGVHLVETDVTEPEHPPLLTVAAYRAGRLRG